VENNLSGSQRRLIIAGMAGNILEWYDFSIYGFFAPAIAEAFFPSRNPATALIETFGVFAAGFIMRPVGALLFGYLGDRKGREKALTLSVAAMAVPTFLMGVLPGHAHLGLLSSILIVVLRLVQGLSVGGEGSASAVFMVERSAEGRRGLSGAFSTFGIFSGVLLGSIVGTLFTWLIPTATLMAWGWRIPFIFGIAIGGAGFLLRRELLHAEPPEARAIPPLSRAIRAQWLRIVQVAGMSLTTAVGFYVMFIYAATYLAEVVGLERGRAMAINTLGMATAMLMLPVSGWLSDRIGRKPLLVGGSLLLVLLAQPLFGLLWHPHYAVPFLGQCGFGIIIGLFNGALPTASAEAFPATFRCTGVAISSNLCMAVFGGTAPMVAAYMIARTHNLMIPAHYLMLAGALSAIFALTLSETAKAPLAE